ncbi:hypothetical protein DUNSADRAFT_14296 [Dunaliella salina]|uniref:Non-specific serine/threonine protein kinase n=1 Tax=Dunaliella salina TaxID=3046 RepID=A0ABQ7H2N9_DUNSA|nr:hypothetical protein DUNSADRAFT_14296 [Dunaliella salina]|eukprot:KAF5841121.1 hypothetical protein DUNSADRAFT_14296 [Dunaliella salina]
MGGCVSKGTWEPAPAPAVRPPKPNPPHSQGDAIEPFRRDGTADERDEGASSFSSVAKPEGEELPRSHSRNPQPHTSDPQSKAPRGSPSVPHTSSDIWAQDEPPHHSPGRGSGDHGSSGRKTPSHSEANDSGAIMPIRQCGPSMPVSWKMGDSVGSGSFGNVYLGLNNDTDNLCAFHLEGGEWRAIAVLIATAARLRVLFPCLGGAASSFLSKSVMQHCVSQAQHPYCAHFLEVGRLHVKNINI